LLDEHLNPSENSENSENIENGENGEESGNGPKPMDAAERERIREEMRQAMIQISQGLKPGQIPLGAQRIINELTAPKLNWRELIQTQLTSLIPSDYSWMRVSRTGWHMDAIMPGMTNEFEIKISVAIDTSGSITQNQATEFLSEVQGIMEQYPSYNINVFCFDTKCYGEKTFSTDNGEDLRTYVVEGGGGTDGNCIFEYLKETGNCPEKLVVFTDGYVGNWGDPNYCDTLWIIKGSNMVPPFGSFAYFDEELKKSH
jgi:predicted metal-dependent peptidase